MKKFFWLGLALAVLPASVWAQSTSASGKLDSTVDKKMPTFQASPKSAVKGVSSRYSLDEDNYLGVTDWKSVAYEKQYFFLGGKADTNGDNGIQGGFATKTSGGHLGLYFNGNLFKGSGSSKGTDDPKLNVRESNSYWNTEFAMLYGSDAIGGIRFDLLLKKFGTESAEYGENAGDEKTIDDNGHIITTLQWGKNLGAITPKIMIGFQWPTYSLIDTYAPVGGKTETWTDAILAIKLEAGFSAIPALAIENQFTTSFGKTTKVVDVGDTTESGWVDDTLKIYYTIKIDIDEKLQLTVRPQLNVRVAGAENKKTVKASGLPTVETYSENPWFWFQVAPKVELGARYQATQKLALYTGLKLDVLTLTTMSGSTYKNTGGVEIKDKPSYYDIDELSFKATDDTNKILFGGNFAISPAFSINASIALGFLDIVVPGSSSSDITLENPFQGDMNWISAAKVVLNFKPGVK